MSLFTSAPELLVHRLEVERVPGLNDLSVPHPHEPHPLKHDCSVRCLDAQAAPLVRSSNVASKRHAIAVNQTLIDLNPDVREHFPKRLVHAVEFGAPADIATVRRCEAVHPGVLGEQFVDRACVTLIPNSVKPLVNNGSCLVCHNTSPKNFRQSCSFHPTTSAPTAQPCSPPGP